MRRNPNLRRKKSNKTTILSYINLILILILIFLFIIYIILNYKTNKTNNSVSLFAEHNQNFSELNNNIPFFIDEILLYSSATANATTVNFSYSSLDISQFCNIKIHLNHTENNYDIPIKSIFIDNIYIKEPQLGTPYLYNKTISNSESCSFSDELVISDKINFDIINSESTEPKNYEVLSDNSYILSIGYYNKNIKENYIEYFKNSYFNGTLLKDALIFLNDLSCKISFTINIITENDEQYICNISFDVPLEDEQNSIYNEGYISNQINKENIDKFIRIK